MVVTNAVGQSGGDGRTTGKRVSLRVERPSIIFPIAPAVPRQALSRKVCLSARRGARSVLRAAACARQAGRTCTPLRSWALAVQQRTNHNKAACALANKLARICYAALRDHAPFEDQQPVIKKMDRKVFAIDN